VHLSLEPGNPDQVGEAVGKLVDVRRFRPNIVLEGVSAWAEFDWVGKSLSWVQPGLYYRINRCLNIDVNPDTGEQDMLFSLLQKHFKHKQTGVLAKVITSGTVALVMV